MERFEIINIYGLKLNEIYYIGNYTGKKIDDFCKENKNKIDKNALNEMLVYFSAKKDFKMMNFMLELGADINCCNNILLLYISCLDIESIEFLIDKNINLKFNDYEALKMAIYNTKSFSIREQYSIRYTGTGSTLNFEDDTIDNIMTQWYKEKELFINKNLKIIELIINNVKNKDSIDLNDFILYFFNSNLCFPIIKILLKYIPLFSIDKNNNFLKNIFKSDSAEFVVSKSDYIKSCIPEINFLLQKGADVQFDNNFLIKKFSRIGPKELFELILEYNPDIHINNEEPLRIVCKNGKLSHIKMLLEKGANIHVLDDEVLFIAYKNKKYNIIEFLLNNGIDINTRNGEILIQCCKENDEKLLKLLIKNNVDLSIRNWEVYNILCKNKNDNMTKIIFNYDSYFVLSLFFCKKMDKYNNEILMKSCVENNIELLEFLISSNIDISMENFEVFKYCAEYKKNMAIIIIQKTIDINLKKELESILKNINKNIIKKKYIDTITDSISNISHNNNNSSVSTKEFKTNNIFNPKISFMHLNLEDEYDSEDEIVKDKKNDTNSKNKSNKDISNNKSSFIKDIDLNTNDKIKIKKDHAEIVTNKKKFYRNWSTILANKLSKENKFYNGELKNTILISKAQSYWNKNSNIHFVDVLIYNDKSYNVYIADTVEYIYKTIKKYYKIPSLIDLILEQSINIKNSGHNLFDLNTLSFNKSVNDFKMAEKYKELCIKELAPNFIIKKPTYKKKKIPKNVRNDVWKLNHGENFNGFCYCCKKTINVYEWECGHIVSEKDGGSSNISNLKPVCSPCNKSMGVMNMEVFKNMYYS